MQTALNTYLKHQELFSVKVSTVKFLLKACDMLMHNCDVFSELEEDQHLADASSIKLENSYIGSHTELMSVRTLLSMVAK